jgi:hypothetical protein
MDKSMLMKTFNTMFFEFFDDIIGIYPENKTIRVAKEKFEVLKKLNPSLLIKYWKLNVYDLYKTQIDAGDIHFFIEKDYSNDILASESDKGFNDKILSMIEDVRATIRGMDETNREHSAKYIQNLSKLSELYGSM